MANYLLAATPMPGHAEPVIEVAAGLLRCGHRVRVLTGSLFRERVERAGAGFLALRPAADIDYRDIDSRFPERASLTPGAAQMLWGVRHLFADAIPAQSHGLWEAINAESTDAVVTDMMFLGTLPLLLAPGKMRPPIAHLGISTLALSAPDVAFFGAGLPPARTTIQRNRNAAINRFMQSQVFGSLQDYVNDVLVRCGSGKLPEFLTDAVVTLPDAYLQIGVPALEYARSNLPQHVRFIGVPRGNAGAVDLPVWWPEVLEARRSGRPVCMVTQGTIASSDLAQLLKPAIEGLADSGSLVIATTSGADTATLAAAAPANVRLARFIPYAPALPHIDVLITNGGFGGVMLALTNGVPLIVAGDSEEKPEIAARVAHAGVGIDLATGTPSAALIGAAAADVLENATYRRRARDVAAQIAAIDSMQMTADILEGLHRHAAA